MSESSSASAPPNAASSASDGAQRLFVGIRVSVATANALAGAVETLARRASQGGLAVRWVPPPNYHVTCRFLGWVGPELVPAVRDVVAEAVRDLPSFAFTTARLGAFASPSEATVIWAGVAAKDQGLSELVARLERGFTELGFAPERRPYHPHVTLGRLAAPSSVQEAILPLMEQMFSDTKVTAVSLFESVTKSSGSAYEERFRASLSSPQNDDRNRKKRQSHELQLAAQGAVPDGAEPRVSAGPAAEIDMIDTDDGWPRGHGP